MVTVTEIGPALVGTISSRTPASMRSAGDRHVVGRAVAQHETEFVAGVAAERVLAAHPAAQPLGDRADHLIGDVEAV